MEQGLKTLPFKQWIHVVRWLCAVVYISHLWLAIVMAVGFRFRGLGMQNLPNLKASPHFQ